MKMQGPKISVPIPPSKEARLAGVEYLVHSNEPGTGMAVVVTITGVGGADVESAAKSLFRLLLANGWVANPVMGRMAKYDHHTTFHAEPEGGA